MTSMDLYAKAMGVYNAGKEECHWCGSPCARTWVHDDPGMTAFKKTPVVALRPGNAFVCVGCHLWRRKRVTVPFFGSTEYKDGRCMMDYSVLVTEKGAWAVRVPDDAAALYLFLLAPPTRFCLSLLDRYPPDQKNLLQLAPVNDMKEVRGDTDLSFLFNGVRFDYSVYELEETLRSGNAGRKAGARVLSELLGPHNVTKKDDVKDDKRQRGRPSKDEPTSAPVNRKVS